MKDPFVEEARRAGQEYVDSFNGDLNAVFDDLRRRTEEARRAGWKVAPAPGKAAAEKAPSKKAG